MEKIISIVTPSFNQGTFISNTISSIISQEGDFFLDYIIQDGGSTDNTLDVINEIEKNILYNSKEEKYFDHEWLIPNNDSSLIRCRGISFRWQSEKDSGQSEAINKGFNKAWGTIAGWVNSDDSLFPGTLKKVSQLDEITNTVYFGKAKAVDQYGKEKWIQDFWKKKYTFYDSFYLDYTPPQPSVFFPLSLYQRLGGLNENLHYMLDTDLWQRMLLEIGCFMYVPEIWSIQKYHPASKSMQGDHLFSAFKKEKQIMIKARVQTLGVKRALYDFRYFLRNIYVNISDFFKKIYRLVK